MSYIVALLALLAFAPDSAAESPQDAFRKQFLTDLAPDERIEKSVCVECHNSDILKPELRKIPREWKASWHFENGVSCHDCHGGDPKDAAMAMSPQRGFIGKPKYAEVPEVCGKCHVGILKHYLESGHGKALKASGNGPNCVTCHGSHGIEKATIEIINEQRCTRCHSYERAKVMKQALFLTEEKIREIEGDLKRLKGEGAYVEEMEKTLFSTHAEFRTLFHTVDVSLVRDRTAAFAEKLNQVDASAAKIFRELDFRRNFSAFLVLIFLFMGIILFLLAKTYR